MASLINMCYQAQSQRQYKEQTINPETELTKQQATEDQEREEQQAWQTFGIEEWEEQQEKMRRDMEASVGYSSSEKRKIASTLNQDNLEIPTIKKETEKYGIVDDEDDKKSVKNLAQGKEQKGGNSSSKKDLAGLGAGLIASITGGIGTDKSKKMMARGKPPLSKAKEASANLTRNQRIIPPEIRKLEECPANMPEIESAVVYQSVEAPQIEPLHTLENHYSSYDLVEGKPATVLLNIKPPKNMEGDRDYSITLISHGGKSLKKIKTKCTGRLSKIDTERNSKTLTLKERRCNFDKKIFKSIERTVRRYLKKNSNRKDTEDGIMNLYKFVELPTQDENLKTSNRLEKKQQRRYRNIQVMRSNPIHFSVFIKDQNSSCSVRKNFSTILRNTRSLYLDFMTVRYNNYSNCRVNETSPYISKKFADSEEVKKYIPMMFPIAEDQLFSNAVPTENLLATCNNNKLYSRGETLGVLSDIAKAEEYVNYKTIASSSFLKTFATYISKDELLKMFADRIFFKFFDNHHNFISRSVDDFLLSNRKAIIIVSKEYLKFHGHDESDGFVIYPVKSSDRYYTGGFNTVFVREGEIDKGTVTHELAHILGQGKEYYLKEYKDKTGQKVPYPDDKQSWCRRFLEKPILCHKYEVHGGLKANFNLKEDWELLNKKFPFMNGKGILSQIWIDRETYQKLFRTFHLVNLDPTFSIDQDKIITKRVRRRITPSVSLLGVYDKKKGEFHNGFSIPYPIGIPTISAPEGDIEVLLAKRVKKGNFTINEVISKVRVPTDFNMEILSETKGKTIQLQQVPIIARLPIPKKYVINEKAGKKLRLIVREIFGKNGRNNYVKNKGYIQNIHFEEEKSVFKKGKILYNAPVNWEATPRDLIIKKEDQACISKNHVSC